MPSTCPWSLQSGAQLRSGDDVHFAVWAPRAASPRVRICNGGARGDHPMTPCPHRRGAFAVTVAGVGAGADYAFVLEDGGREIPDPASRWQPHGVHGPSRVVDPAFHWTDDNWRGVPMNQLAIYELHVGAFSPEGNFAAITPRIPHLARLGITAVELMPVAQFPGARNWGYDGVGLYAPHNGYGGPAELKKLVDRMHAHGIAVILDVVYNHMGPEGNYLDAFGPYFTEKYKTPWGRALNYDDADCDEVRRFIIDNALYWVSEYHIDGLRLDAVHGIFDFSARHLCQEIAAAVHDRGTELGKSLLVIAESDLNDHRLVRPIDEHGFGLDGQWSDDFHHAVHAALTGERRGYYADFGPVSMIADALREPFVYDGRYSVHRRRRHGAPSTGVRRERFVVCVQNHDQVGNRARGDRLATLLLPAQQRLAAALLLLSPYMPLLFMGEEYGETNPFQYFVDHSDEQLIGAIREGRRREFESFDWTADVPDPFDEETFRRSKLDMSKANEEPNARLLALYRDLLTIRREDPLMRPGRARISVAYGEPGWITLLREPANDVAERASVALFNCSDRVAEVPLPGSEACAWTVRSSTDDVRYGGRGAVVAPVERTAAVPAWSAVLLSDPEVPSSTES